MVEGAGRGLSVARLAFRCVEVKYDIGRVLSGARRSFMVAKHPLFTRHASRCRHDVSMMDGQRVNSFATKHYSVLWSKVPLLHK